MNFGSTTRTWTWATLALVALPWVFVARSGAQEDPAPSAEGEAAESEAAEPEWVLTEEAERRAARREKYAKRAACKAVDRGLRWLAANQEERGSWHPGKIEWHRTGVTALALLAFLRRGHHPGDPEFGPVIVRGIEHLLSCQLEDGRFWLGPARDYETWSVAAAKDEEHEQYEHLLSTMVLLEVTELVEHPEWVAARDRAIEHTFRSQNPYMGFRYGVRDGDNDTSVTGLAGLVLQRARDAGISLKHQHDDESRMVGVYAWLKKMTHRETGRVGYQERGGASHAFARDEPYPVVAAIDWNRLGESNTAMAIAVRMGDKEQREEHRKHIELGIALLDQRLPEWSDGQIEHLYYVYFGSVALKRSTNRLTGKTAWRRWKKQLEKSLLGRQEKDGDDAGSWPTKCVWGNFGPAYSTAMCCLSLDVEYSEEPR